VEVCRKATLHVVVIIKGITKNVVILLALNTNNRNPEMKTAVLREKSVKLIVGGSRDS